MQEKVFLVSRSQNLKVGSSCQSILHKWVSSVSMEAVLLYSERSVAVQMNRTCSIMRSNSLDKARKFLFFYLSTGDYNYDWQNSNELKTHMEQRRYD